MSDRGSVIIVSLPGDYGKPRPAVVVQASLAEDLQSLVICPLTSEVRHDLRHLRPKVVPDAANGLRQPSEIMVDKLTTVSRPKAQTRIGSLGSATMAEVDRALAVLLGLV